MENNILYRYGINDRFLQEATLYPAFDIGRVCTQHKDLYRVITRQGEVIAKVAGRYRYTASNLSAYPAVGDFVMLAFGDSEVDEAVIHHVLTRKSTLERKMPGTKTDTQIIASNIDTVFLCMALNNDYNLARLERYLSVAWASRALPVVVLTKYDLCSDIQDKKAQAMSVAIGVDVLIVSAMSEDGYQSICSYVQAGQTMAFIGSSGVGKSTLINLLTGKEVLQTGEIQKDGKGKHTTSHRQLMIVKNGGIVIDTPGMRELGLEGTDLLRTFADIDELAKECRFRDCSHQNEPGCSVQEAIRNGQLGKRRLANFLKLKKEAKYEGLNSKQIEEEKINTMFSSMGGMKNARKFIKAQTGKNR